MRSVLSAFDVERDIGALAFLNGLRSDVKSGEFSPLPVREREIPKPERGELFIELTIVGCRGSDGAGTAVRRRFLVLPPRFGESFGG